jgi:hypoxanthine phosphoribosyltransferase
VTKAKIAKTKKAKPNGARKIAANGSSAAYTATKIQNRVAELGRQISKASNGRRLDIVITMDRAFMFGADLVRAIEAPSVLHFLREDVRDIDQGGNVRREVFFGGRETVTSRKDSPELKGRDVLLVDAVLESGITQDFLLRRIGESQPRSLRLVVLLDKTSRRRVSLEPDYFGFRTASNQMWVGYGLAGANGTGRAGKHLTAISSSNGSGAKPAAKKSKNK